MKTNTNTIFTKTNIFSTTALLAGLAFAAPAQATCINCNNSTNGGGGGGNTNPANIQQVKLDGYAVGESGGFNIVESTDPDRMKSRFEGIRTGRQKVNIQLVGSGNGCDGLNCTNLGWTADVSSMEDVQTLDMIEVMPGHGNFESMFRGGGDAAALVGLELNLDRD